MKEYTLKFLDSESFDKLPYSKVYTSLGVADQNSGVAYVRDTASPVDVFTAMHELEHLKGSDLEEHATAGEPGIYYKDTGGWMQTAAPFAAFVPGVGPALSAGMGVGGSLMSANSNAKAQKSAMQNQQQPMNQFNPGAAATPQAAAPATSQVGGGGMAPGGQGSGLGDTIRNILRQRQSGFYSGRDAGGSQ